jgi:hypothetical protein
MKTNPFTADDVLKQVATTINCIYALANDVHINEFVDYVNDKLQKTLNPNAYEIALKCQSILKSNQNYDVLLRSDKNPLTIAKYLLRELYKDFEVDLISTYYRFHPIPKL